MFMVSGLVLLNFLRYVMSKNRRKKKGGVEREV